MLAIGGLGNPGKEYAFTRHNVGFMVAEALAEKLSLDWENKSKLKSEIAKDKEHILFKPLTYVNSSGEATKVVLDYYLELLNKPVAYLWIIHDDTEIPFGEVRVKLGGTSGGHNGIKSIDDAIGPDYWRIRVGVGRPSNPQYDLAEYVLSTFTKEEAEKLPTVVDRVTDFLVQSIKDNQLKPITFNTNDQEK